MNNEPARLERPFHNSVLNGPAAARVRLDNRDFINFAGCSYLALGRLPELRDAAMRAIQDGVAFACQLPSVYGVVDNEILDLERTAASYLDTEDSVYFSSGYLIGAAALATMDVSRRVLFIDERAHFNLWDAARSSGRPFFSFGHCDPEELRKIVRKELSRGMKPVILTDGVFGTTGEVAPLNAYGAIVAELDGTLIVDEAHSFGVLGPNGRGAADYHQVENIAVTSATLSKAFCAQGAILGCTRQVAETVKRVPPLRGANQGSPISAAVAAASFRYMIAHPERRSRLMQLSGYLRSRLKGIGIEADNHPTPIVAFRVGDRKTMGFVQKRLFAAGIYIMISNYISAGKEGIIRCAVFADHMEADLDTLVESLAVI